MMEWSIYSTYPSLINASKQFIYVAPEKSEALNHKKKWIGCTDNGSGLKLQSMKVKKGQNADNEN